MTDRPEAISIDLLDLPGEVTDFSCYFFGRFYELVKRPEKTAHPHLIKLTLRREGEIIEIAWPHRRALTVSIGGKCDGQPT